MHKLCVTSLGRVYRLARDAEDGVRVYIRSAHRCRVAARVATAWCRTRCSSCPPALGPLGGRGVPPIVEAAHCKLRAERHEGRFDASDRTHTPLRNVGLWRPLCRRGRGRYGKDIVRLGAIGQHAHALGVPHAAHLAIEEVIFHGLSHTGQLGVMRVPLADDATHRCSAQVLTRVHEIGRCGCLSMRSQRGRELPERIDRLIQRRESRVIYWFWSMWMVCQRANSDFGLGPPFVPRCKWIVDQRVRLGRCTR